MRDIATAAGAPEKKIVPPPPPFLMHLIKPVPETVAPPTFTIASAAFIAPMLPASAAKTSPVAGGVPAGTVARQQMAAMATAARSPAALIRCGCARSPSTCASFSVTRRRRSIHKPPAL
jgi:hypothetical protein